MIYGVLEIEIMNAMWAMQSSNEDANISVADIVSSLQDNNVERAYTTIKTVMDRLVQKGTLARYRSGKKFYYRTTIDKDEAAKNSLTAVAQQFFGSNYSEMIRFAEREYQVQLV